MRKLLTLAFIAIAGVCAGQHEMRIVTAGSAITETVCALGDCDKLVGTDRTSLYPAEVQDLPSIGYRSGINAEGILSLRPTLVIAEKDYVDQVVLEQLSGTSVEVLVIDRTLNFEGTKALIRQIATPLNRRKEGDSLIANIEQALADVRGLLEGKTIAPTVACIYNRGTATVSAGGKNSFAEILAYAGAQNAFIGITAYKPLNAEALISANPDYVLMVSTGFESLGGIAGALKLPGMSLTTAGKKKQIIAMESLKLTNFGPRFGEAVKELAVQLHPELADKIAGR